MKTAKFGGSSVASAAQIMKVKAILDRDPERRVVVVSAPGKRDSGDTKVTDMLLKCASLVDEGKSPEEEYSLVKERYWGIADGLGVERSAITPALEEVGRGIAEGRGRDYAASRGEHLNARLIAMAWGWTYVETKDRIVIRDDGTVDPVTYDKLSSVFSPDGHYVVPGFYGSAPDGTVRCFSRGGSDITGSIVARTSRSTVYENWTDVSGVYSSDPRKVGSARVIPSLSYTLVREMGEVGASVFHEEAIAPVVEMGIPINIRNTNSPEEDGTLIGKECSTEGAVGVSARDSLALVSLQKLMLFKESGALHRIRDIFTRFGLRPVTKIRGTDSISWYLDAKGVAEDVFDSALKEISAEIRPDRIEFRPAMALLGIVGQNLEGTMEYVKALSALREKGITPVTISFGGSGLTFTAGIEEDRKLEALNAVSECLFA